MISRQPHYKFQGYDGVYGQISIFPKEEEGEKPMEEDDQMTLF